jgi:hypothetical protein
MQASGGVQSLVSEQPEERAAGAGSSDEQDDHKSPPRAIKVQAAATRLDFIGSDYSKR